MEGRREVVEGGAARREERKASSSPSWCPLDKVTDTVQSIATFVGRRKCVYFILYTQSMLYDFIGKAGITWPGLSHTLQRTRYGSNWLQKDELGAQVVSIQSL